jgi:hypothetical protein
MLYFVRQLATAHVILTLVAILIIRVVQVARLLLDLPTTADFAMQHKMIPVDAMVTAILTAATNLLLTVAGSRQISRDVTGSQIQSQLLTNM